MKVIFKYYLILTSAAILLTGCDKSSDLIYIIQDPWVHYGSLTDRDGNIYKTIQIGTQTWMVSNLKTTRLNDGTKIPVVNSSYSWDTLSVQGCCWLDNNPTYRVTYGILYNWHAVNSGKLCPSGWHAPSDNEWKVLIDYLGGESGAGGKLKEAGLSHWYSPNNGATNDTYFRALPGGYRSVTDSLYHDLHQAGYWWTTSGIGDNAFVHSMNSLDNFVHREFLPKRSGFSVRCVWDY